jgi:cytochrome c oxidase cbb3-type subunit 1
MSETQSTYNYKVVRQFAVMTVIWGIVGMLVGVIIAAQLVWPDLNLGFLHFGRLRPLHTNAVIFAFGGSALFATSYYVVQRTCHTRLFSRRAGCFHFLGLAGGDRSGGHHAAAGDHPRQGVCRARMAD